MADAEVDMSDILILIECDECGHEQYFEPDSLPGGAEHCAYCEKCCAPLMVEAELLVDAGER